MYNILQFVSAWSKIRNNVKGKNVKLNFIYHEDLAKIVVKILNKKGVINVGGPIKSIYKFAKKDNPNIKKIYVKNNSKNFFPLKCTMNLTKINKII